jgi:ABC transporter DrrB family efflux protein
MTTTNLSSTPGAVVAPRLAEDPAGSQLSWAVRDTIAVTGRNLLHYVREPQLLMFTFVQPIMFVLLFRYVFGGAIPIPGISYVNYLMPGIFVQTVLFGAVSTGVGLAEDMKSGIIERFRSLPMTAMAVLAGRTVADLVRNIFVVIVMFVVGYAVGFRPSGSVPAITLGLILVVAFAFALSWVFANVGMKAPSGEAAQAVAFPILFPLTFASSAFVPVNRMPSWLQPFAAHQPVTVIINACRGLMLGPHTAGGLRRAGLFTTATASYLLQSVAWISVILLIAAPAAVRRFRKMA